MRSSVLALLLVPGLALGAEPHKPYCSGEYADELTALAPRARELESQSKYTFCIRTSAVYECPSYGPDGNLRGQRREVTAHGTGFAYRQDGGDTLLITNEHVADWPAVTDAEHTVEDVPSGCKRVADTLRIVDSDEDVYERDDIPLTKVVADPQLDIAILRAHTRLSTLPWRIGRSSLLKEGNTVSVRGFPLGVLKTTNVGKVVSAYDHDDYKDWDHDDFVVDALLSQGNSGSPVLAVNCKTGEYELVGVYHAGYARAAALNVVIALDQLRDIMTLLKRTPRPKPEIAVDARGRVSVIASARSDVFFPIGNLVASVHVRDDGALIYALYDREFPYSPNPVLVMEDLLPVKAEEFGSPGGVYAGNERGLKHYTFKDLPAETRSQLGHLLDAMRRTSIAASTLQASRLDPASTRERFRHTQTLEKALHKTAAAGSYVAQSSVEIASDLAPRRTDTVVSLNSVLNAPAVVRLPQPPPDRPMPASAPTPAPAPAATR